MSTILGPASSPSARPQGLCVYVCLSVARAGSLARFSAGYSAQIGLFRLNWRPFSVNRSTATSRVLLTALGSYAVSS